MNRVVVLCGVCLASLVSAQGAEGQAVEAAPATSSPEPSVDAGVPVATGDAPDAGSLLLADPSRPEKFPRPAWSKGGPQELETGVHNYLVSIEYPLAALVGTEQLFTQLLDDYEKVDALRKNPREGVSAENLEMGLRLMCDCGAVGGPLPKSLFGRVGDVFGQRPRRIFEVELAGAGGVRGGFPFGPDVAQNFGFGGGAFVAARLFVAEPLHVGGSALVQFAPEGLVDIDGIVGFTIGPMMMTRWKDGDYEKGTESDDVPNAFRTVTPHKVITKVKEPGQCEPMVTRFWWAGGIHYLSVRSGADQTLAARLGFGFSSRLFRGNIGFLWAPWMSVGTLGAHISNTTKLTGPLFWGLRAGVLFNLSAANEDERFKGFFASVLIGVDLGV
jgi:hypothetical protein